METSLELYHHGVKGQHWGSRNGPPYPLYRKSAYYKKTGKRPPGYTGNKSGSERSSGGGKIGGLSDIKRAGGVKASVSTTMNALRRNKKGKIGGLSDIKRAGLGSSIGVGLSANPMLRRRKKGKIGGYNDDDKRSATKKKILKGVGIAAGAAALAGAGYLAYRNRAAIGSKAGKLRDDIRFKLGELPGTAKLNQTRVDLKNKILSTARNMKGRAKTLGTQARLEGKKYRYMLKDKYNRASFKADKAIESVKNTAKGIPGKIDKNKNKLYNTYLREAGKVRRSASNAKDYVKRTYHNKIKTIPRNTKELLSKPGSKVYERIADESKRAAQAANYDLSVNAKRKQALEKFIQENPKAIENATIAKRKVLANIRRGDYVKSGDTLRNLNAKANKLAAKERDLVAKGNEAKRLLGELNSQTKLGTERYNAAMATFKKRNRLGKIAAGATNAGIGLGLAGAAGGAGYGISRLARKRRSRKRRRR